MSVFVVEVCFVNSRMLDPGSCFRIQSLSLCVFISELSPLILSDINDQWLLTPVIYLFIFGGRICVFPFFGLCLSRVVR